MTTSPRLGIPFISGQQAQPEVTHNQAVLLLQAAVGGAITQQNAPPGAPDDGDCYIVGTAGSGAWAGKNNCIAIYLGGWLFLPGLDDDGVQIPMGADQAGLNIFRVDLETIVFWDGATWGAIAGGGGGDQSSGDFADSLADLIDVDVSGAVDGYVLTYDAVLGKWVAEPSQGGGSGGGLSSGDTDTIASRHIIGTTTNDDAPAGYIGEYVEASAVNVALVTGTPKTIVSIPLPSAGDWDVSALFQIVGNASTNVTGGHNSLSLVDNVAGTAPDRISYVPNSGTPFSTGYAIGAAIPAARFKTTGPTTVYAVAQFAFTVSTCLAGVSLHARRVR